MLSNLATLDASRISVTNLSEAKIPCVGNALQSVGYMKPCLSSNNKITFKFSFITSKFAQQYIIEQITHNTTERCLSKHVLKPRFVAVTRACSLLGTAHSGYDVCGITDSNCCSYRPCIELFDDAYLLASVDVSL